jgi:hypothetical protein
MELEESRINFKPVADKRPTMPEPPPVWLVAVEDVRAPAPAGCEVELDEFYGGLLRFEREGADLGHLIYKAENFRLQFDVVEPPITRDDLRAIAIEVPSLQLLKAQLNEREIEYQWQRGLFAGGDTLLFLDPAGNWVAITERRQVM